MIKKTLAFAVLGTCVTSATFAFTIFPDLKSMHKHHPALAKSAKNTIKQDAEYTDFSGTWAGTCNTNGETDESTVTIHNDGVYIEFDGQGYSLGALNSESSSSKWSSSTSQMVINWNEERTQLNLGGTMIEYTQPDYPYNTPHPIYTLLMTGYIALKDGHLNMKVEGRTFDGLTPIEDRFVSECIFDKVN